jgi:hypothetical protein
MENNGVVAVYRNNGNGLLENNSKKTVSYAVKVGLAQMLRGGVIMDVVDAAQARIAEEAGAVAVMALERVPADIRAEGGVARMSDPSMIKEIKKAVTIPVMAKARIGELELGTSPLGSHRGHFMRLCAVEFEEFVECFENFVGFEAFSKPSLRWLCFLRFVRV